MSLADRMREARLLSDISARELAELADLSEGYPAHIESGRRKNPGTDALDNIARVLGVSLEWLIRGKGDGPTKAGSVAALEAARRALKRRVAKGAA